MTQLQIDLRSQIRIALDRTRRRTLALVDELTGAEQRSQMSPLMSPVVWDLAHVGNYEEIWLQRALGGPEPQRPELDDIYDAFKNPRADRPALELLDPSEARAYVTAIRARVLDRLARVDLTSSEPLLRDGFVYGMVLQHEHQHDETILATRQLMGDRARPPRDSTAAPRWAGPAPRGDIRIDGGPFWMGTSSDPWAYDNERPAHVVTLPPFRIDRAPVTNGQYAEFVAAGGYDDERLWAPAGWAWRQEAGLAAPENWRPEGDTSWSVLRFGVRADLAPGEAVQHVCWYEADAYARSVQRRLPTEAEWERAASASVHRDKPRWPWGDEGWEGRANLGQRHFGPAEVGAYADGVSPAGCHQMIGDTWEWTASDFAPYPGFTPFPYDEYSRVFWGTDYKVLRGGAWGVDPLAARTTFRNWDYPIRRQIFAGFRCARDDG